MEGFIPNCRTSATETNWYNNNEAIYSQKKFHLVSEGQEATRSPHCDE